MKDENKLTDTEKEIDKIIVQILIPITDELKSKTKEIREKRLELNKELSNMRQLKQSLIEKRKRLNKQKIIYEKHINGDFSNVKTCQECLNKYINIIDKKQNDFLKDNDDYYELKLRKKKLEFDNILIDLIKEKTNIEKKNKIKRKMSFEAPRKLNQSSHSINKNLNKSFKSDIGNNNNKNKNKSITPKRVLKAQKSNNNKNSSKDKNSKVNRNLKRKNSNESNRTKSNEISKNNEISDISGEIEKLINNYSSKKNGRKSKNSKNSENFSDGLEKLKEINKDTKNFENDLKEIMNDFLNEEKE